MERRLRPPELSVTLSLVSERKRSIRAAEEMDRYQKVEKPREETPINDNEIRITAQGRMRSYITYATNLLQRWPLEDLRVLQIISKVKPTVISLVKALMAGEEKSSSDIVFKAMGRAINKTVMIVELIKRRIVGLHQIAAIGSIDITDTWEPLEEGLLPLETTRHVSMITITLSRKELDTSAVGYQSPLPADQKVRLLAVVEAMVVAGEEPVEMVWWTMVMEDGTTGVAVLFEAAMPEVEAGVSVVVAEEALVVDLFICTSQATMIRRLCQPEAEVMVVEGAGVSDQMGTSKQLMVEHDLMDLICMFLLPTSYSSSRMVGVCSIEN
ncbi:Rpp20 subunit of nuclear RNase MRP and P [Musa troglodytarum]|uniref:Rpp20 subunit of nuclear RNase MRP and P n=1 Tax=Musa troglodytarum TaxID=320322 RepID=A0A9E7H9J9_9LILI|nr:Rpp20 subunit of nuclear RNase MRP and P [Musa troglodytarum]